MLEPIALTTADFRCTADSVAAVFAQHNLSIVAGSDLDCMLRELRWVGKFDGVFTDAVAADRDRTARAVLLQEQMSHIADAVRRAPEIFGAKSKLRHLLRNPLNAHATPSGPGLECLFELEVASRLVRPFWQVSFEEPDIVLDIPGVDRVALACKRPRKKSTVGRNIKEASSQVKRSGLSGYAMISLNGCIR